MLVGISLRMGPGLSFRFCQASVLDLNLLGGSLSSECCAGGAFVVPSSFSPLLFLLLKILFIFRERGREGERDGEKH